MTNLPCNPLLIKSRARFPYAMGTIESSASGSPQRTKYPSLCVLVLITCPWLNCGVSSFNCCEIMFPMPPSFFVSKHVCFLALKNHAATGERGSFGYEHHRIFAGIRETIFAKQFGQTFDVEFIFRNDATVGSPG